jgi:hypothetical protein
LDRKGSCDDSANVTERTTWNGKKIMNQKIKKSIEKLFDEAMYPKKGLSWRRFERKHQKTFEELFQYSVGLWLDTRSDLWKYFEIRKQLRTSRRKHFAKNRREK